MLKSDIVSLSEKNGELKKQVRELSEQLRLAEQGQDHAQKQFLVLGKQQKAGPPGTVKGLRTNPTVVPDPSIWLSTSFGEVYGLLFLINSQYSSTRIKSLSSSISLNY